MPTEVRHPVCVRLHNFFILKANIFLSIVIVWRDQCQKREEKWGEKKKCLLWALRPLEGMQCLACYASVYLLFKKSRLNPEIPVGSDKGKAVSPDLPLMHEPCDIVFYATMV